MIIDVLIIFIFSYLISYLFMKCELPLDSIISKQKLEIIGKNIILYGIWYTGLNLIAIILISPGYVLDIVLNYINIFILIFFVSKCLYCISKIK